jgi:LPS sulfotransferase NodH
MSKRFLFVCGMFRSGTTLLGRVLNAHPCIAVASDPYLPFFKTLRSREAAALGLASAPDDPLDDYYFKRDQIRLFEAIQRCSLDAQFDAVDLPALRQRLRAYGEPFSPLLAPHLDQVRGGTYRELFDSMLQLLAQYYDKPDSAYLGFKEVWADEFIPCLARAHPDAKFIQIVRDPRAVCASKNVTGERYTWLFMARQWRKLAALAWQYQHAAGADVMLIRYEDLVSEPLRLAREICAWLEIEYAPQMADPASYVDGQGRPWKQNTSYGTGGQRFDNSGVDKWRSSLKPAELDMIETLSGPEMLLHGYRPDRVRTTVDPALLRDAPRIDDATLAAWARNYMPNDAASVSAEMNKEKLRYALLRPDGGQGGAAEAFLFPALLEPLRGHLAAITQPAEI